MKKVGLVLISFLFNLIGYSQGAGKAVNSTSPFVLGVTEVMSSKILSEKRTLNIYLPEGFHAKDSTRYPIIYLLDGSADEDFIHVVGLVHFNSFPWIKVIPKSIVVGIANVDRKRDFTFPTTIINDQKKYPTSGHSEKFISFIESELQPYIQKKYNGNNEKTIIGQSLGGLLVAEILFKKPYLFSQYIIVSPSVWWNNGSILKADADALKQLKDSTKVYMAVGKEGLTPGQFSRLMEADVKGLFEKIESCGNPYLITKFDYLSEEDHATIEHQAIYNAFKKMNQRKTD